MQSLERIYIVLIGLIYSTFNTSCIKRTDQTLAFASFFRGKQQSLTPSNTAPRNEINFQFFLTFFGFYYKKYKNNNNNSNDMFKKLFIKMVYLLYYFIGVV